MTIAVGFTSRAPGSGKTYAANHFAQFFRARNCSVEIVSFATPVKHLVAEFLTQVTDLSRETILEYCHRHKDQYVTIGTRRIQIRDLLVAMGTFFGRDAIDRDVWLHCFERTVNRLQCDIVLVDDVRFSNEALFLRSRYSGILISVDRVDCALPRDRVVQLLNCDYVVCNDGTEKFARELDRVAAAVWLTICDAHANAAAALA